VDTKELELGCCRQGRGEGIRWNVLVVFAYEKVSAKIKIHEIAVGHK
jgi:hypothetical protein